MRKWLVPMMASILIIAIAVTIYFQLDWFRNVLAGIGTIAIIALSYYLLFPQNAKIILSHIGELGGWIGGGVRKFVIKNRVEGYITKRVMELDRESDGAMPYPVSLTFVSKDIEPQSYLESGRVIVKLNYKEPAYMNIVDCALLYCRAGLIPETREYLTRPQRRAIDLETIDAILRRNKMTEGLIYFRNQILPEQFGQNPDTKPVFVIMEDLEERGYFTRILLVELTRYPAKIRHVVAKKSHHSEIADFISFLQDIANRPPRTDVKLDFVQERLRVGVIIFAKSEKFRKQGPAPYVAQIKNCRRRGEEMVYLIGVKEISSHIPDIAKAAQSAGLATIQDMYQFKANYDGKIEPAYYARLELKEES